MTNPLVGRLAFLQLLVAALFPPIFFKSNVTLNLLVAQEDAAPLEKATPKTIPKVLRQNSFKNSPAIFYWHLNLQYINDYQNGNLVLALDDYYTYGIAASFALNNWEAFFAYRSFTDRYASKTRIDEMQLGLRYIWGNLLSQKFWQRRASFFYSRRPQASYSWLEPFYLGLTVSASYFVAGDLAGQVTQNQIHELIKVPKVYGRYLDSLHTLALDIESYLAYTAKFRVGSWQHSLWQLGLHTTAQTAIGYQQALSVGLRSKLYSGNQYLQLDLYLKQLGYYNGFGRSDTVESVQSDVNTALWLAFSSRVGLYQRKVQMSFGSLQNTDTQKSQLGYPFGFGSIELSWAHLQAKLPFVEPDFAHSLLVGLGSSGLTIDRFAFLFRLGGRIPCDFSVVAVRDHFRDPKLFDGSSLARKGKAAWLGMLHFRPTLDLDRFGFLEFYAGLGAGLQTLEFLNSIKIIGPRSSYQHFAMAGQAGLRWYGLALRRDAAVYGIEAGLFMLFPEINVRFLKTGVEISTLEPKLHFMLGFTVLTDW